MAAIRELKSDCYEGIFYIPLALFFGAAHGFAMWHFPMDDALGFIIADLTVWGWLALFLAPAVIILFLVLGIINLAQVHISAALVKIFFGLTLVFFLFETGANWPVDIKGMIAVIYCLTWFHAEFETAK